MSEPLKLNNQICFPMYSLAKEIIGIYRPFLENLSLTYPQYLVMMVLWEHKEQTVSDLGTKLNLDSGTLTPLLKRLEQKDLITRNRNTNDERVVTIRLTESGKKLKKNAEKIPVKISQALDLSPELIANLKTTLENLLTKIEHYKKA